MIQKHPSAVHCTEDHFQTGDGSLNRGFFKGSLGSCWIIKGVLALASLLVKGFFKSS